MYGIDKKLSNVISTVEFQLCERCEVGRNWQKWVFLLFRDFPQQRTEGDPKLSEESQLAYSLNRRHQFSKLFKNRFLAVIFFIEKTSCKKIQSIDSIVFRSHINLSDKILRWKQNPTIISGFVYTVTFQLSSFSWWEVKYFPSWLFGIFSFIGILIWTFLESFFPFKWTFSSKLCEKQNDEFQKKMLNVLFATLK